MINKASIIILLLIMPFIFVYGDDPNDSLFDSINYDNIDLLISLLKKGADPNLKNEYGVPALTRACEYQTGYKNAELLISYGADVNGKDDYGITALMMSSYYGYKDIVELLVSKGANINIKTLKEYNIGGIFFPKNSTALTIAAENGQPEIVKILKKKGG